jgi:uridylate kinase|nr:UMP kinase [uncultured Nitrososphaera sp.]
MAAAGKGRVVIKLSGKVFSGEDGSEIKKYASMLAGISSAKVQPVVVAGGGKVARHYIGIARGFGLDEASLDIMGIEVSRLNAKLLIAALGEKAHPAVPQDLEQVTEAAASGKIVVAGGLHPGQSTNATSALIAEKVGAARFVNATDVDGIYDSDPRKNRNAKRYSEITTKQCRDLLAGESSMAGGYDLMDIVALKVIERSKIPTVVIKSEPATIKDVVLKNKAAGTKITVAV